MRKSLTIAIPTYNRYSLLKESLVRLMSAIHNPNIEVFVTDNASTDGTEAFMQRFCKEYPMVRYHRNTENRGFYGNFINCFIEAKGEYLWILSDDDVILPNGLTHVLEVIQQKPDFVYLSSVGMENPSVCERSLHSSLKQKIFSDKNTFLRYVGIYITFISALIFRMDEVRKMDFSEFPSGNNVIQSYVAFSLLKNARKCVAIQTPCVAARGNERVSYDVYKTWVSELGDLFLNIGTEYNFSEEITREVLYKEYKTVVLDFILKFRLTCPDSRKWDENCVWPWIAKFPNLVPIYELAMHIPLEHLDVAKKRILELKFLPMFDFCKKWKRIYLYGAGEYAEEILEKLNEKGRRVTGILITGNPDGIRFHDLPIQRFADANISADTDGIIVAMCRQYQLDIEGIVEDRGFGSNVYWQDVWR